MAADSVPALYLDAWARLQCQKPTRVSDVDWRLALHDGGLFLDAWGEEAAALGWTPGALFDVASGLVWRLAGERVEALGPDHAGQSGRALSHARQRERSCVEGFTSVGRSERPKDNNDRRWAPGILSIADKVLRGLDQRISSYS
jgi:hypothetical protein